MDWRLAKDMTRMVLVRHGQPEEEGWGLGPGVPPPDVGLSATGRLQAERAARYLAEAPLLRLYASPLRRALESAAPLAALKGMVVDTEEAFQELDAGHGEGPSFGERVRAAARDLRRRHVGETFALVSHGGVTRTLLAEALGMPDTHLLRLDQGYAAVNVLDFYGDEPIVRGINLTFG